MGTDSGFTYRPPCLFPFSTPSHVRTTRHTERCMTTSLPDLPPCAPARIAPLGAQHALFGGWLIPRRTVRSTVPHGKCCFRPRVSGFDHAFAGAYRRLYHYQFPSSFRTTDSLYGRVSSSRGGQGEDLSVHRVPCPAKAHICVLGHCLAFCHVSAFLAYAANRRASAIICTHPGAARRKVWCKTVALAIHHSSSSRLGPAPHALF